MPLLFKYSKKISFIMNLKGGIICITQDGVKIMK